MIGKCCLFSVCIFLYFAHPGFGEGTISVDSKVDKSTIRIGDLVTYSVIVTHSPELQVERPDLGANLGAFEIRDYQVHEPREQDGEIIERVDYTISTFDVGEFEIPPLTFYYTVGDDSTRHELKTQRLQIVVESLKPSEAGDIRDIKRPWSLPRDYRTLILWGSIILAVLILLGISLYIWYRKRTGRGVLPQKVEPPRPAHEIALEQLRELQQSSLLQEGKVKQFYIELSDIIRHYIEGRYFIVALELTTAELIADLQETNVEPEHVQLIHAFLQRCDLVKFAKYMPTETEIAQDVESAFRIVDETKLVYEAVEPETQEERFSDSSDEAGAPEPEQVEKKTEEV